MNELNKASMFDVDLTNFNAEELTKWYKDNGIAVGEPPRGGTAKFVEGQQYEFTGRIQQAEFRTRKYAELVIRNVATGGEFTVSASFWRKSVYDDGNEEQDGNPLRTIIFGEGFDSITNDVEFIKWLCGKKIACAKAWKVNVKFTFSTGAASSDHPKGWWVPAQKVTKTWLYKLGIA